MMPNWKVIALIWAVCLVAAAGVAARSASAAEYTSGRHGFSIPLLPGWETTEVGDRDDGVVVLFNGPDGAVLMVNIAPESLDLKEQDARDRVLDGYLDALENGGVRNIEIIDEGEPALEKGRGYSMHYIYLLPNGIAIESVSTFLPGAGRHFIVTLSAVPRVYKGLVEEVSKAITRFSVKDKGNDAPPLNHRGILT